MDFWVEEGMMERGEKRSDLVFTESIGVGGGWLFENVAVDFVTEGFVGVRVEGLDVD